MGVDLACLLLQAWFDSTADVGQLGIVGGRQYSRSDGTAPEDHAGLIVPGFRTPTPHPQLEQNEGIE